MAIRSDPQKPLHMRIVPPQVAVPARTHPQGTGHQTGTNFAGEKHPGSLRMDPRLGAAVPFCLSPLSRSSPTTQSPPHTAESGSRLSLPFAQAEHA